MKFDGDLRNKLWEKSGGKCAYCHKPLIFSNTSIEHIRPLRFGGTNEPDNLLLVCKSCNADVGNSFTEREFQYYIKEKLEEDGRFASVEADVRWRNKDGANILFDLMFIKETNGQQQLFVVEVKSLSTATEERVDSALQQMEGYQKVVPKAQFVLAVPAPLAAEYRDKIKRRGFLLWDQESIAAGILDTSQSQPEVPDGYDELLARLRQCPKGFEDWRVYQKLVGDILDVLFCPPLEAPAEQNADGDVRNRRDYILPNYAENGYWRHLRDWYKAEYILVDAKNSASAVAKEDILQVSHYLKEKGLGMFGLIFSRAGVTECGEKHLRDIWQTEGKMLLILDDRDVEQLLLLRKNGDDPCRLLMEKIQEFRQTI